MGGGSIPANAAEFGHGFFYRRIGDAACGRTIVALHGSGADEATMLPLVQVIDPTAQIIVPRGRIDQNGERRWFRKLTPTKFERKSIRTEAQAFAGFLDGLQADGVFDLRSCLFLGYSNGGNLLHSAMLLHPGRVRDAILLRCMPVLGRPPMTPLAGSNVLIVGGSEDQTYGPFAGKLAHLLSTRGATVCSRTVNGGHMFGEQDVETARRWLGREL